MTILCCLRSKSFVLPSLSICKHLLPWNHWAIWNQMSLEANKSRENETLFRGLDHITKLAAMPIYQGQIDSVIHFYRSAFSNISSKATELIEAMFQMELLFWSGTEGLGHMTKMAAMSIYVKNPLKIIFSRTLRLLILKLCMKYWGLGLTNVFQRWPYINLDLWQGVLSFRIFLDGTLLNSEFHMIVLSFDMKILLTKWIHEDIRSQGEGHSLIFALKVN